LYGGIAQGLGYGLLEEIKFHEGYLQSLNFDTYMIPTALDVPEIEGTFVETSFPEGPYGAKNLAEPVLVGTAPAIANAVFHATGTRHVGAGVAGARAPSGEGHGPVSPRPGL
jgi:CO/xanthine dehydrogenase Mo-binding subunit